MTSLPHEPSPAVSERDRDAAVQRVQEASRALIVVPRDATVVTEASTPA